jgi:hypothetical protein
MGIMGIEVHHRSYELSLTSVAGGTAGALIGGHVASNIVHSTGLAVVADATGATLGGRLKRIPSIVGSALGSAAARRQGASPAAAALSAHVAGKLTGMAPQAESALGDLAASGEHAATRAAAKVGETALHEAPGALGAIAGAKLSNFTARGLVWGLGAPVGAFLVGSLASALLPDVTWSSN